MAWKPIVRLVVEGAWFSIGRFAVRASASQAANAPGMMSWGIFALPSILPHRNQAVSSTHAAPVRVRGTIFCNGAAVCRGERYAGESVGPVGPVGPVTADVSGRRNR